MNKNEFDKYKWNIEKRLDKINENLSDSISIKLKEPEHSGICPGECQSFKTTIKMRRMNTAYVDEDLNYIECCNECFEEVQAHWKDMWDEYYSGIL